MSYAAITDLDARYPGLVERDNSEKQAELDAASAFIESYCHRTFDAETGATVRYFRAPDDLALLDLGGFEISTTDGVIIATDDGTNTYSTTLASTEYQLEPVNAAFASPDARPYTTVRRLGGSWPRAYSATVRQERIKVTAKYGWPSVPEPIKRACTILAAEAFENPSGVRSEAIDGYSVTYQTASGAVVGVPDSVVRMLGPYRRGWAA